MLQRENEFRWPIVSLRIENARASAALGWAETMRWNKCVQSHNVA